MPIPADARLFAVVPGAGTGQRMAAGLPKQYLTLRGSTLAEQTLTRLLALARIQRIAVPVAENDPWWPELALASHPRILGCSGGASRADSVVAGLEALLASAGARVHDWVLVHDMARPCVRLSDIERLLNACGDDGAILALPVTDTVKQADAQQQIERTLDRSVIWRALTPQLFPLGALLDALKSGLSSAPAQVTDEASAMEMAGARPLLVAGRADNIKITLPDDLPLADWYLAQQEQEALQWQSA